MTIDDLRGLAIDAVWPHTVAGTRPTPVSQYLQVGPGWYSLVVRLVDGLESVGPDFGVHLIGSDSDGNLDIVFNTYATRDHHELARAAKEVAALTCWYCGDPAKAHTRTPSDLVARPVCLEHLA